MSGPQREARAHATPDLHQVRGGVLARRSSGAGDTLALLRPTVPAEAVAPHRHDDAHWVLVLRGRYEHSASGGGCGPLVIANPPRTEHRDRFAADVPLPAARFVCLQLSAGTWWRWQQGADLPTRPVAQGAAASLVRHWLQALRAGQTPLGALDLDEVLAAAWQAAPTERSGDWLDRARRLLRERCLDDSPHGGSLTGLAARLRVHPVSLTRAFRRRWGLSPSAYAQGLRLDRAAALLRARPRPSVAEVAALCGFHDQAHLTRHFRAAYGQAPQRWRA